MNKQEFLKKYDLIEISEKDGFVIDIKYATSDNFTNEVLYDSAICYLRRKTAEKIIKVNNELRKKNLCIKIWDAFRPLYIQEKMWKIYPDERFVANPAKGNSNHCKGSSLDVTICTLDGSEIKMPTEYDHFGIESSRTYYANITDKEVRENVLLLENTMIKYGFEPFLTEWWHFNDLEKYDIIREFYE